MFNYHKHGTRSSLRLIVRCQRIDFAHKFSGSTFFEGVFRGKSMISADLCTNSKPTTPSHHTPIQQMLRQQLLKKGLPIRGGSHAHGNPFKDENWVWRL